VASKEAIIVQVKNPSGPDEPLPVLRVFDDEQMMRLKRAFFEDTLRQVAEIDGVDIKIAVAPASRSVWAKDAIEHLSERFVRRRRFRELAKRSEIIVQSVAPIDDRTAQNLARCLDNGYDRVVLVGGYHPTLEPERLHDALRHLRHHPLILGPTIEGGCYLIGIRSDCRKAIGLVTLGSDAAYSSSTAALTQAGIVWQEIDLSYDVGHQEDLEFIVREINHCRYVGDEDTGLCTENILAEFIDGKTIGDGLRD
jgi:glycosyltransferase A (GT-A) superfamily protein (DUF2064 family)